MFYKCNQCGAPLTYSPGKKAMYCEHCDGINTETVTPGDNMTSCTNCGAPVLIGEYTSALKCEHCGCHLILDQRVSGQYQPHLILPFIVGKETAKNKIKEHLKDKLFIPSAFLNEVNLDQIQGEYVPFWLYDYKTNYNYVAKATKIRRWMSGNTEYTETSVFDVYRNMDIDFSRVPADASKILDDSKMDLMEPYDYSGLQKFEAKYMSGFSSEIYNYYANQLETRARGKVVNYASQALSNTINGYDSITPSVQDLRVNNTVQNYALLPVWVYRYPFGKDVFEFFINGQTGKIIGKAPKSKAKAFVYSLFSFAFVVVIAFLFWAILEVM